ncbi:squalene/phytoene synthase family protein [Wenzhouxiangella sp. XN201]|uniref:phytoene/squalene synthase family protein n=1 Tax=Wenzhouxiangella sp. XN201 TaxID=2710755 RepID=UPI0013CBF6CA|nr:squalene/phytoene synthase family protein [Wenzhouxiangella sp. XN201]NEZ03879.1 squalene/phytoene synthase family protein [Wenzhouxiangella sp. XN201]
MDPLDWCRERLLLRGSPLAASLPFAPAEHRDAILALRAAISEIAAVPDSVSEPMVGEQKLAWWREALRNRAPHPAIEAMSASGALDRLQGKDFDELIDRVIRVLEPARFERRESAWQHCLDLGGPAAILEARLIAPGDAAENWRAFGGFAYFLRLVRDLAIDARSGRWPVPLDLQAEYQLARQDVVGGEPGRNWDGLVRAWLADGMQRFSDSPRDFSPETRWQQRHLLIGHALDRRLLKALARRPRKLLESRIRPGHAGNVWVAWRTARRLRKATISRN